jgi:hypothetical protein
VCLAAGRAVAQGSNPVVEAKILLATDAGHPNSSVKAAVVAQVASGYHINDHRPSLDYLIPTELKLESSKRITVEQVIYPRGVPRKFAFSDAPLSVYEGTVLVGAVLKVARVVPPGAYTLQGKFSYQACNDHACLPPASLPLSLTVKVVRRAILLKHLNADVFDRIQFE